MAEIVYVRDANGNLVQTTIKDLREDRLERLEEENKKLKEENEYRKSIVDIIQEGEGNVAEETIKDLQDRIKELKEEVRFLEECLDRKEKLNVKYRKEIEKLKSTYVYDAKQVRDIC